MVATATSERAVPHTERAASAARTIAGAWVPKIARPTHKNGIPGVRCLGPYDHPPSQ